MLTYTENIMKNYNVHLLRDTVIHDKNLNIDINKLNITAGEVSSGYTVTKNNDLCDVAEVKIVTGRSELCLFNALRILYHEEEHARQAQLYKNPDGPASMAAMHAACMLDTNYYKHNYLSCLFEIDAEY